MLKSYIAGALAIILLGVTCTASPLPGSCTNSCGGQSEDGLCHCDSSCELNGDCCKDYLNKCAKCTYNKCGDQNPYSACYCDDHCKVFGDCCPGVDQTCSYSCKERCGEISFRTCSCDPHCLQSGDCCIDYSNICVNFTGPATAPSSDEITGHDFGERLQNQFSLAEYQVEKSRRQKAIQKSTLARAQPASSPQLLPRRPTRG